MNFLDPWGLSSSDAQVAKDISKLPHTVQQAILGNKTQLTQIGLTATASMSDLKEMGEGVMNKGIAAVKEGNKTFWSDPYGDESTKALKTIAKGADARDLGNVIATLGKVGKVTGTIGDLLQATQGVYQLATGDIKGAVETAGDYLGGALGSAGGGAFAGAVIASTGIGIIPGAVLTVLSVAAGSFGGGAIGEVVSGEVYEFVK